MWRRLRLAAFAGAVLTGANCAATMTVSSHVDRTRDFSADRTYAWGPADVLPTGDARLDGDPVFRDRLQGAVEKQLAAQGLRLVPSAAAGLLFHYHANVTERIDANRVDAARGFCTADNCPADVTRFPAGTLILDAVDARTGILVWRAWAQTSLEDALGHPERLAAVIDQAAARMLQRFPGPNRPATAAPTR